MRSQVQETGAWTDPPTLSVDGIVNAIMPTVAASPGFAAAYQYGDEETENATVGFAAVIADSGAAADEPFEAAA